MKLLRVGAPGEERPAVRTEDGRLLDLSPVTSDIDGAFLASGGVDRARVEDFTLDATHHRVDEAAAAVLEAAGWR